MDIEGEKRVRLAQLHEINKINFEHKVRSEYNTRVEKTYFFKTRALYVILILSALPFIFLHGSFVKTVSVVLPVYLIIVLSKREGRQEGYIEGYSAGVGEVVKKIGASKL